jgi:hypothetical protein
MQNPLDAWDMETWRLYIETYRQRFQSTTPFPDKPWPGFLEESRKFKQEGLSPQQAIDLLDKPRR